MLGEIPLELLTLIGTGLLSGVMTMWSQSMRNKQEMYVRSLGLADKQEELTGAARSMTGWQFTRRFLAIGAMAGFLWPLVVPVFWPHVSVTTGWTEMVGGFWFFTDPKETIVWHTVSDGITYNPFHNHILSAVFGFFFGNQVTKRI